MTIENLHALAEQRFDHALYRKNLRERVATQLAVAHNGGLFIATQELIAFLCCWEEDAIFLEDTYQNPIKCDRMSLLAALKEAYQYAMNAWHIDFEESKKIRKISTDE